MPAADAYPSSRPATSWQKSPPRLRNPLDYFRQWFQPTQSNASVPDIIVQSPSETASSLSEHVRQARPESLSLESAHRSLPPTHEEHARHLAVTWVTLATSTARPRLCSFRRQ
ncbi:hypothetical protein AZE42_12101 [Rhizopogon vesiculosus]|uniref:Uncharacterized protein n=1 Tax=Rhizopogon vesiculosus TaxID=180088 RepID=A0A1J8PRJ5_9AGAM|nr:hypothetical protein AZE42_12101 [Rhizopogon vesiculosus]